MHDHGTRGELNGNAAAGPGVGALALHEGGTERRRSLRDHADKLMQSGLNAGGVWDGGHLARRDDPVGVIRGAGGARINVAR